MRALHVLGPVLTITVLLLPGPAPAATPSTTTWYWTAGKARTELALDGITARCHGRYDRLRVGSDWYYRYFRCTSRAAGRFDLLVRGEHLYDRTPAIDPDPAP